LGVNALDPCYFAPIAEDINPSQTSIAAFDVAADVQCRVERIENHCFEGFHYLIRKIVIVELDTVPFVNPPSFVICAINCDVASAFV